MTDAVVHAPKAIGARCGLARRARAAGMSPQEFLAPYIARHSSLRGTAEELGVTRRTVELWLRKYGITVVRR